MFMICSSIYVKWVNSWCLDVSILIVPAAHCHCWFVYVVCEFIVLLLYSFLWHRGLVSLSAACLYILFLETVLPVSSLFGNMAENPYILVAFWGNNILRGKENIFLRCFGFCWVHIESLVSPAIVCSRVRRRPDRNIYCPWSLKLEMLTDTDMITQNMNAFVNMIKAKN